MSTNQYSFNQVVPKLPTFRGRGNQPVAGEKIRKMLMEMEISNNCWAAYVRDCLCNYCQDCVHLIRMGKAAKHFPNWIAFLVIMSHTLSNHTKGQITKHSGDSPFLIPSQNKYDDLFKSFVVLEKNVHVAKTDEEIIDFIKFFISKLNEEEEKARRALVMSRRLAIEEECSQGIFDFDEIDNNRVEDIQKMWDIEDENQETPNTLAQLQEMMENPDSSPLENEIVNPENQVPAPTVIIDETISNALKNENDELKKEHENLRAVIESLRAENLRLVEDNKRLMGDVIKFVTSSSGENSSRNKTRVKTRYGIHISNEDEIVCPYCGRTDCYLKRGTRGRSDRQYYYCNNRERYFTTRNMELNFKLKDGEVAGIEGYHCAPFSPK